MTIRFRCRCGEPLRASDDDIGERIRCRECGKSCTVPDGDLANEIDRPSRRSRDEDDEPRPRSRSRTASRRSGGSSNAAVYFWIGGAILSCLIVGIAIYFAFQSKSSGEKTLIGEWETDPFQAGGVPGFVMNARLTFQSDHSYRFAFIFNLEGRWQVVSRDGNQLKVRLVHRVMGMEQNDPPTATITIVDQDHIEFAANDRSLTLNGRFRRVGTGPPALPAQPNFPLNVGPRNEPFPGGPDFQPNPEPGVVPDCEVLWSGSWFKAKVMKAENDRWFIHYVGWGNNWDEWVGKDRIRFLK